MKESFYDVLGIGKQASADEIKKAYKKCALRDHPDRGGDAEKFKKVNRAYEVLGDPDKKKGYDLYGENFCDQEGMDSNSFHANSDIFNSFFRNHNSDDFFSNFASRPQKQMKMKDVLDVVELSLEQVYRGVKISKEYSRETAVGETRCEDCGGRGFTTRQMKGYANLNIKAQVSCQACDGLGKRASGVKREKITLDLRIPRGCKEGYKCTFEGKVTSSSPGVQPGNLIYVVKYKDHPLFKVNKKTQDLLYTENINLFECLAGGSRFIKHLDNKFVKFSFDNIELNKEYILKGLGLTPDSNLHVHFNIKMPEKIDTTKLAILRNIIKQNPAPHPSVDKFIEAKLEKCQENLYSDDLSDSDDEESHHPQCQTM